MPSQKVAQDPVKVAVNNIGGINETELEFNAGVTLLVGRNATNRTSFLQAIMAGLGSENVNLKGDAKEGSVNLTFNGETYTRTLSRQDGTIVFDGEPYLNQCENPDLFAFLLESNEARRAVERGDDLYDLIMRPVDTDEIDTKINQLKTERQELESELEELENLERRLPSLEEDRNKIVEEIDEKQLELESKRAKLEEFDATLEASEAGTKLEELREARQDLQTVRADIEDEKRIVEAIREDRATIKKKLEGLGKADDDLIDDLDGTISQHRSQIQTIESTVSELKSVIKFNESMLEGSESEMLNILLEGEDDSPVTDQLLAEGQRVVCWTCGTEVERNRIERTIELLQDAHSKRIEERNDLRSEIDELEAERKHIERTREERRELSRKLDELKNDLNERSDRLEALREEAKQLEADVQNLEIEIESLEHGDQDELLATHREANKLEFELDQLDSRLNEVEKEITSIESRLAERDKIEDRREEIDDKIEELRSRIERLETEAVEQFNDHMDCILDLLEFENLERVWIERVETEVNDGRRKVRVPTLDLHVVRTSESGSAYEDRVEHLSESEREVVGLVFALSGYLVHGVYEKVPFMLLDSLEAVDADRISELIDYLGEQVSNLVVALLPEDAAAVEDGYERIAEI